MNLNLDQIRAASALAYAKDDGNKRGSEGGDVVRKLPALIMSNGLLATAAFAYQKEHDDYRKRRDQFERKRKCSPTEAEDKLLHSGYKVCFDWLTRHMANPHLHVGVDGCESLDDLLQHLTTKADSQTLKLATDEALAWLTFARRFVTKPPPNTQASKGDDNDSTD